MHTKISIIYSISTSVMTAVHVIARNDRWFTHLHIQNGSSKRIWILTYSWTGNFLLAWAGQFAGIKNQTMHRFEQYLKILHLYHENSRFPPSFKFWSVSAIQKHWEEVKKCILHGFQDLKALFFTIPILIAGTNCVSSGNIVEESFFNKIVAGKLKVPTII
jgi:hypothetical protein